MSRRGHGDLDANMAKMREDIWRRMHPEEEGPVRVMFPEDVLPIEQADRARENAKASLAAEAGEDAMILHGSTLELGTPEDAIVHEEPLGVSCPNCGKQFKTSFVPHFHARSCTA